MSGFEDVTLAWKGEEYVVPASRMMPLIAQLEEILGGASGRPALSVLMQANGVPPAKLSMAFGAALRFAGARVRDDEVYLSLMEDLGANQVEFATRMQAAIMALIEMIAPPVAMRIKAAGDDADPEGDAEKKS